MIREMPQDQATVFVVEDDDFMRQALSCLLRSVSLHVECFGSAAEFLMARRPNAPTCLVLDVWRPRPNGLDVQAELAKADSHPPIVFLCGHADIPTTVKAMKAGAFEFFTKPFREQDLLDAVIAALDRDRIDRDKNIALAKLRAGFNTLTPREQQVIGLVTSGLMNKQIAFMLGLSEITVKVHRGSGMRKMGVHSLVDLVRMADWLGLQRQAM